VTLAYHEHECPDCGDTTVHHTFSHESQGDEVEFWCRHCEEDVTGTIGEFVA
jgi:predicted RNA-binding Zn-ribbon protein involved in translation (DUF1610 family)